MPPRHNRQPLLLLAVIGKDDSVTSKEGLSTTRTGRSILKEALFKSRGYRTFVKYKEETARQFPDFESRFVEGMVQALESDGDPVATQREFAHEIGTDRLMADPDHIDDTRARLLEPDTMADRVHRILDSNFVKMTFPVFNALFDAANPHSDPALKRDMVEGHILAIDLSEPMDRIVDRDEDLEYLKDYRLMNPYILGLARSKISRGGVAVLKSFEDGFRDARSGQYMDEELKSHPDRMTEVQMEYSYKKYRAVMGTAGANMAMAEPPLSEAFYSGMAHASEAVGCGNEIEDSLQNGYVKVPSWPLYYSVLSGDVHTGFEATLERSRQYLERARLSLRLLPDGFTHLEFLKFLFMTVEHYTEFWYNRISKADRWLQFQKSIPVRRS